MAMQIKPPVVQLPGQPPQKRGPGGPPQGAQMRKPGIAPQGPPGAAMKPPMQPFQPLPSAPTSLVNSPQKSFDYSGEVGGMDQMIPDIGALLKQLLGGQ